MKTAIVTGATSGIGKALTLSLAARGVRVVALGRNPSVLKELARGSEVMPLEFDLSADNVEEVLPTAVRLLGAAPDFLVNNAGYNSRKAPWVEVEAEELDALYRVNLRAPLLLSKAGLALMMNRGSGHILNVISTVVHRGIEEMGAYTAMKQGLLGGTRVLIKEAAKTGIKVTAFCPGGTDTDFRAAERPEYMRPESVAEMAEHVLFAPRDVVVHEMTFRPMVETNF
ncbi:MAG: SDR family oxidoreductase [Polyangiaceae bacterium]|nr:SDR family oxidoreductase [Polyangiaceae bacterium]